MLIVNLDALLILLPTVFFYTVISGCLFYFCRRLDRAYLKFGAWALLFELTSRVLEVIGQASGALWHEYAAGMLSVCSACALFVSLNIIGRRNLRPGIIVATLCTAMSVPLVGYALDVAPVWLLIGLEVPGLLLLAWGVSRLPRTLTPALVSLSALVCLHIVIRPLPLWPPFAELPPLMLFDEMTLLLIGGMLVIISAEQLIASLKRREAEISRVEQENHRLEVRFSQAQKHESLGVLAGGIAHDFNNMLTSILGYTGLAIKKLPTDSEVRKDLYMVMSGARQAVELTSQMLMYAGKGAIEFKTLDISTVLDNMSSLVNSVVPARTHLSHKIAKDLPMIRGDAVQLGQVVMNLVANAVDAIGLTEGDIELQAGLAEVNAHTLRQSLFAVDHEPGAYVFLRVADSGVGIEAGQMPRIFDPFYSDKSTNKGLGLSSISGIVRQHKGFLHVTSEPGKGSVFTVYLPLITYNDNDIATLTLPARDESPFRGRVLLADDDTRIRALVASVLESDAYNVVAVSDGREALQRIGAEGASFDAFILDCTMPRKSGTDIYREIRAAGLDTPVLLMSGYHQEQVIADISHDAAAHFVKKPFGIDELLETLNLALTLSGKVIR